MSGILLDALVVVVVLVAPGVLVGSIVARALMRYVLSKAD